MGESDAEGVHAVRGRHLHAVPVEDALDVGERAPTVVGQLDGDLPKLVGDTTHRELDDAGGSHELECGAGSAGFGHSNFLDVHFFILE